MKRNAVTVILFIAVLLLCVFCGCADDRGTDESTVSDASTASGAVSEESTSASSEEATSEQRDEPISVQSEETSSAVSEESSCVSEEPSYVSEEPSFETSSSVSEEPVSKENSDDTITEEPSSEEIYDPSVNMTDITLCINEITASNNMGIADSTGNRYDWIELYNYGDKPITLKDIVVSCEKSAVLPDIQLGAGEYILLFASEKCDGAQLINGYVNVCFKLPKSGAVVTLQTTDGKTVDRVSYPELESDLSYARNSIRSGGVYSNGNIFTVTTLCTPGYPNTFAGLESWNDDNAKTDWVVINEVMTSNSTQLAVSGKYYDWIELKNVSSQSVTLSGLYLSDDDKNLKKWALPSKTLAAGELYVVIASGLNKTSGGYAHTSFKLSASYEQLFLSRDGVVIDAVTLSGIPAENSYGRMDGKNGFYYFAEPTPAKTNKNGYRALTTSPISDTAGGAYTTDKLTVKLSGEGKIYYTLDGSVPTEKSTLYTDGIQLSKTTVIRAVSITQGKLRGDVFTAGYFLNEGHTLPIVSIAMDPDDLWSYDRGIYAIGAGDPEYPHKGANFLKGWERAANISLYEEGKNGFSLGCGIAISGSGSRSLEKKSFRIAFKSKYGSSDGLDYALFDGLDVTHFESIKLRCGEDYPYAIFREELATTLVRDGMPTVAVQAYKYCVLYLNGEYWGIYAIKEKFDEDFVAEHEDAKLEDITVLENKGGVNYGSNAEYKALVEYAKTHDLRVKEYYDYVISKVDMESICDWVIAEAYTGNRDLGNVRFYKVGENGKWRWVFYDLDWGFYNHANSFYLLTSDSEAERTAIIRALLKNPEFEDYFLKRVAYHLKYTFADDVVKERIEFFKNMIDAEVTREREKWGYSYKSWINSINTLVKFIDSGRRKEMIDHAVSLFKLTSAEREYYFSGIVD